MICSGGRVRLSRVFVPISSVPRYHRYRPGGAPATGGIRLRLFTPGLPDRLDTVDPRPGFLYFISAHEQGWVIRYDVKQEALVGCLSNGGRIVGRVAVGA